MAGPVVAISINASWNIVNFRLGLIRGLQAAGYRVVALTPPDRFAASFAALGIDHVPIPIDGRGTSPLADLALLWRYWRALRRLRPAAYLGYTIKPNIWGSLAARLNGVPVINNIAGLGETFGGRGPLNRLVRWLYRQALRGSATVFFQNPDDRALFVAGGIVPAASTRSLPGSGVDLARFAVRRRAPASDGGFVFLLIARLLVAKGVGDFVAAARLVRERAPAARFRVLGIVQQGKGAIPPAQLDAWARSGDVELLPATDDVRDVLAEADCVVLPTFYPEGTPRALLEAAASGLPIIATDVPGCREIVRHGRNGFLVRPRDPQDLADRMIAMAALPPGAAAAMGAAGRALVEREFDERIVVDAYLAALDRAVGRGVQATT